VRSEDLARLIHTYADIKHETVWNTVHEDLPPLIRTLEKVPGIVDSAE